MKTYKYEFSHQSNLIQIGNLIDDLHSVHVHLLRLQRRYHRIYSKYASTFSYFETYYEVETRGQKSIGTTYRRQVIQDVAIRIDRGYQCFL